MKSIGQMGGEELASGTTQACDLKPHLTMKAQSIHLFQAKLTSALAAIEDAKQALRGVPQDYCGRIESKIAHAENTVDDAISILKMKARLQPVEMRDDDDQPCKFSHERIASWLAHTQESTGSPIPVETYSAIKIFNRIFEHEIFGVSMEEKQKVRLVQIGNDVEATWRDDVKQRNGGMIPHEIRIDLTELRLQESLSWLDAEKEMDGKNNAIAVSWLDHGQEKEDGELPMAVAWIDTEPENENVQAIAPIASPCNIIRVDDRKAWLKEMKQKLTEALDEADQIEIANKLISAGSKWLIKE